MKNKLSQKQAIFCLLYQNYVRGNEPKPPHWFMGEQHIDILNLDVFISYEASARLSEMNKENPNLLGTQDIKGKSGSTYFGYYFKQKNIVDTKLLEVYNRIKRLEHNALLIKQMSEKVD